MEFGIDILTISLSRGMRDLRRGTAAARLLLMRVRIHPVSWMSVVGVVCC
jgi:hypothetical protein